MGQARQRGTFEERRIEGIVKRQEELEKAEKKALEDKMLAKQYYEMMPLSQRTQQHNARAILRALQDTPNDYV